MCVVSVVQQWSGTQVPQENWTRPIFNEYQEIIKKLEELDRKLGFGNCEDPAKAAWMKSVEERLKALEASK